MTIITIMIGIAVFAIAAIYGVSQWYNAKRQVKSQALADANQTVALIEKAKQALKEEVGTLTEKINDQGKEIAGLQGEMRGKDQLIERYTEIFKNRNPELEILLKAVAESMKEMTKAFKDQASANNAVLTSLTKK